MSTFIDQEAAVSNDREPELNIDRQKEIAATAVEALSADSKQELVGNIVQSVGTDQKKQIAATAVDALSADSKQELVGNVVHSVGTDQKKQIAATAVEALPQADKEDVAASILGIPDRKTQQKLWYIVVGMMGGAIFVFGILTFVLVLVGKSAEGVVALATTALGGVVGLVSTSPVSSRRLH